ncbi:hypothetical protein BX600DRAFT_431692 [Xylariales sp. PMI_506]|nr:hypothetical protein BX600DRAFT_431692 [Xylariales sp. PMI_506]
MSPSTPRVHPLLPRFERIELVYKSFNGTVFDAVVLVPKSIVSSDTKINSPVAAHFHGGNLIMGTPLDPEILSVWPLELAESVNATIISPAYRLAPEAQGSDILEDV